MRASERQNEALEQPSRFLVFLVYLAMALVVIVPIAIVVMLHVTDPEADEKALLRDLHARSVALDYAESNTFDLFTAFKPHLSDSSALTSKTQLQRTYNLFHRQVRVYPADDHPVKRYQWHGGIDVPLIVRLEPDNRRETLINDPEHLVWVRVSRDEGSALEGRRITLAEDSRLIMEHSR